MDDFKKKLLNLIIVRLVLVSLVLGFAIFALSQQVSAFEFLQPFILAVYALSVVYALLWQYTDRLRLIYNLQFCFDLILISLLIFISGGINSLFTPFYVLIIVYASLLKHREGGIIALTLSITSYSGIVHLGYLGWVPGSAEIGSYSLIVYRISLNTLGFMGVAMLGIYLSERLQSARQELGTAKVVHQTIVDSIRDGLITLDLEGRITSCNRTGEEIYGFSHQELLLKPISKLLPESVLESILKSDFESNQRALHIECWSRNRREESLFVALSCSPLFSHDHQQTGYILSIQDLTEIKKREEEVQLQEKMAAIGQLAAGLAHEIRNPLGSLWGSIQVLQSELHLSDQKARLFKIIIGECKRLNKIVGDFLAYAGPRSTQLQKIDLLSLVQETVDLFMNSPEFHGRHSIEILPSTEPLRCLADSDQFRQVVWNIIQNGVRAMPSGGKLSIQLHQMNSRALISFTDDGIGMSSKEEKELFQPFLSGFKNGTGLGMAIVYEIIQQHHGEIDIRSRRNAGTVIDISLPLEH